MKNSDEAGRCLKSMGNALKLLGNFSGDDSAPQKKWSPDASSVQNLFFHMVVLSSLFKFV